MVAEKPVVFIGSSSESLEVARHIRQALADDALVEIWKDPQFSQLGETTLPALHRMLERCDFGIFVFGPDDSILSRGLPSTAPRDNVLLEFGMFLGRLGPERTYVVVDNAHEPKIPSNLAGIRLASYSSADFLRSLDGALGPACDQIRQTIRRAGSSNEKAVNQVKLVAQRAEEIAQAVKDVAAAVSTRAVGTFPNYMNSLADVVHAARRSICIACDYASYGMFSSYLDYERYRLAVNVQQTNGVHVDAVFLDVPSIEHLLKSEFQDWDATVSRKPAFRANLKALADRIGRPLPTNAEEYLQASLDEEASERRRWGAAAKLREVGCFMPTYLWIADDSLALFTSPVFDGAPEHAFTTRDPTLIRALRSIWQGYASQVQQANVAAS